MSGERWDYIKRRGDLDPEEGRRLNDNGFNVNGVDTIQKTTNLDHFIEDTLQRMSSETSGNEHGRSCKTRRFQMLVSRLLLALLLVGYLTYTGFVLYLKPSESAFVCIFGVFVSFVVLNKFTNGALKRTIGRCCSKSYRGLKPKKRTAIWIRRILTVAVLLGILVFLVIDLWNNWHKWTPFGGFLFFILLSVVFSKHPRKINWIPVLWGIILQFCLGLLILRWDKGFRACQFVGAQVTCFLGYTDKASEFVFGEKYEDHVVVFKVLPVVIFFSAIVAVMYFLGAMQTVIKCIASVLQYSLNSTPIESFATAAHIFIGQVESSVALRPFWMKLTESELHAIMTGGFATVAGTVIAAYVEFGVPAEHVISASFMSAPAALAIAKISIPETEISSIKSQKEIKLPSGQETNMIEALSVGATTAIKLVAYVVVNLIAFIAVLNFLDATLTYFGSKVNYPDLSFQLICSYIFMPLAAMMGVPWEESNIVAALIGKKIVINEFLAYIDLGAMIQAGTLSGRSIVLATYILCGFGSIPALGINLGALTSAAPGRRAEIARLSWRAMINGNIACFMTACVAGLLYQDIAATPGLSTGNITDLIGNSSDIVNTSQSTLFNSTSSLLTTII